MKKLPVGIQTFRKLIEEGYVYADKTEYIYNMTKEGSYYFLSRPRRFGKSLLVDTMKELFEGSRELFKGLWVDGSDFDWKRRPVIRIDMTQVDLTDTASIKTSLTAAMKRIAKTEQVNLPDGNPVDLFIGLIEALREQSGERVVVLIDEYDKPIIDFISDPDRAARNREVIGNFYGVLKGQDANLEFVFLTGVSKFAKTSIFSKLNNMIDLTMWDRYAGICGFTEADFDALFPEFLDDYTAYFNAKGDPGGEKTADEIRDDIFGWYDGYTWDGETRVFNPFSLLSFFKRQEFFPFWYETGTPTFLPAVFKERPDEYLDLQDTVIDELSLGSHEIEDAPLESLLFQTGFLTVKSVQPGMPKGFVLGFPNREVAQSFGQTFLASAAVKGNPLGNAFITGIRKALDAGEPEKIAEQMRGLYASIPYQLHRSEEAYYQTVFLATMQFLGFRVMGEVSASEGRIDGVIEQPNGMAYVVEFKYVADGKDIDSAIQKAFAQIEERGYANRYAGTRKTVFKVAAIVAGRGEVKVAAKPA